jgi:FYVE/RhoGEF/PH domain-containing protein 5/6
MSESPDHLRTSRLPSMSRRYSPPSPLSKPLNFPSNDSQERLDWSASERDQSPARNGPNLKPAPPHLPFRRISLPSTTAKVTSRPTSIESRASFDSLHEDPGSTLSQLASAMTTPPPGAPPSSFMRTRQQNSRPTSMASNDALGSHLPPRTRRTSSRSRHKERSTVLVDEGMQEKRRKVIMEIFETERAYTRGLDMIYEVGNCRSVV